MRWLFVLLLVANTGYLGWELDRETAIRHHQAAALIPVPASAQRLPLLEELPELPSVRTLETAIADPVSPSVETPTQDTLVADMPEMVLPETGTVVTSYRCFRYGPLLDQDQLASLQEWFTAKGARAESHYVEEQGRRLYWIYLAPQPSRENAMTVLQEMRSRGIGDFRLINRGDLQNAISLGLFSSREAVDARLEELKEKGYVPVVVPYADVKRIYSLDVRIADTGGLLTEAQQGYPAGFESVPRACEEVAAPEDSPAPVL